MSTTDQTKPNSEQGPDHLSAMFASLVLQQTNMATIFLGLSPHPQSGKVERDLEHARYFIDQLEMLEAKTRGNLDNHESALLKQSLTHLRLAFVEAVSKPEESAPATEAKPVAAAATEGASASSPVEPPTAGAPAHDDSKKKFSKKY